MISALLFALAAHATATRTSYVMVSRNGIDGQTFDGLNEAHGTDKLSLYNTGWGTSVNPNQFNILVRVNDDRIVNVRAYNATGSVSILPDTWVIAANGVRLPLLSSLAKGDVLWVRPTDTCNGIGVPILTFHDLGDDGGTNFETTLQAIANDGYETITESELTDWMNHAGSLPTNPLLITFDDAYDSHFSFAPELLHDYGMSGLFFVIGTRPGTTSAWASWAEILSGFTTYPDAVEIGCHSYDAHSQPGGIDKYLTMTEAERITDLASCKSTILSHLGVTPTAIAWPFGGYDEALVQDAQDAGFTLILTQQEGLNVPQNGDAPMHMRRFGANVANPWSTVQTTMSHWYVCD